MFLSRYAELFEVDVFCDGCKSPLTRSRYRCLNCFEIDLCATCYNGKHSPNILTLCSSSEGAEEGGGGLDPIPSHFLRSNLSPTMKLKESTKSDGSSM